MSAAQSQGLLVVMIDIEPEFEDEFNRWYEEEHLPEREQCAGFLTARRYVAVDGQPKYLAIYELEDVGILESDAYREIGIPSRWMKSLRPHFTTMVRNVYRALPRDPDAVPKRGVR